jgi:hypothetical protein
VFRIHQLVDYYKQWPGIQRQPSISWLGVVVVVDDDDGDDEGFSCTVRVADRLLFDESVYLKHDNEL